MVDWDNEDYEKWYLEQVDCPECVDEVELGEGAKAPEDCHWHGLVPVMIDSIYCSEGIHPIPIQATFGCGHCGTAYCDDCYEAL